MAVAMIGPKFYAWDRNGKPLAFGKLYTYQARTNTPRPTYQSEDQVVENTNPVILNGEGYANVYLDGPYKMVLKDANNNEIWSSDPVTANSAKEWVNCFAASYVSPTSFKIAGNQTAEYRPERKLRIDNNSAEYGFTSVVSSVYASGETSVVVSDGVVTTGILNVCTSVVSSESSFNKSDLSDLTNCQSASVADMLQGNAVNGAVTLSLGQRWAVDDYYGGANPNNSGVLHFKVVAAGTGTDDGGSYIDVPNSSFQFEQVFKPLVSVKAFGAKCDALTNTDSSGYPVYNTNATDDTDAAKNTLAARPYRKSLDLDGDLVANLDIFDPINGNNCHLFGNQTLYTYTQGDVWKFNEHINVNFRNDANKLGALVSYPDDIADAEMGRHSFLGCSFLNSEIGVYKPQGNIGDRYRDCSFLDLDYGYYAVGNSIMHPGAMSMDGCHFWGMDKAAIFIDNRNGSNTAPTGGLSFNNCIVENSVGFGAYLRGRNTTNQLGETPFNRIEFNGFWYEGRPELQPEIMIDGTMQQPRAVKCVDMADTVFRNSYIYDMELVNSTVFLENMRVDREFTGAINIDIDDDSMVYARDLSCGSFGGFPCDPRFFVESWRQCNVADNSEAVLVRMPACTRYSDRQLLNLKSNKFDVSYVMSGSQQYTPTISNDGVLSATCCQYTIPASGVMQTPTADRFSPTYGWRHTWVVFTVSLKIVSGELTGGGMRGAFEIGNIQGVPEGNVNNRGQWVTVRGYKKVWAGTSGWAGLTFTNASSTDDLVIKLADYSCGLYESEAEALDAVNNGVCVVN